MTQPMNDVPQGQEIMGELFEYAPDAMLVVNEKGQIVRLNQQVEILFGYDRQELLTELVEILLPKRFRQRHIYHRAGYLAEPRLRPMGANLELFGLHKDGHEIPINIMLSTLPINDELFVIAIIRDIMERKYAENALRQSEGRFRALFEQSPYALFLNTPDDKIVDVNPAACQLLGYSREALLSMHIVELQAPDVRGQLAEQMQQGLKESGFIETTNLHQDGRLIPVEVRTTQLAWQDQGLILSVVRDITERQYAEAQIRASLQEKEVMLKEIHHRVKNNLQIVSSLLKLQAGYIAEPQMLTVLQESQNRVRAMALVHETLYQSQDLGSVNFARYLEQLVSHLRNAYSSGASEVTIEITADPVHLELDTAVSCGLVVNELISNALKYAFPSPLPDRGKIEVILRRDENAWIELIVQDNGVGFPSDLDFRQTETLGLQLVNILVEDELEGNLTLEAEPGTKFTIMLSPSQSITV